MDNAENALYQLIKVNPNHCGGLQQLARVLVDSAKQRLLENGSEKSVLKGAMDCYEKTISLVTDVSSYEYYWSILFDIIWWFCSYWFDCCYLFLFSLSLVFQDYNWTFLILVLCGLFIHQTLCTHFVNAANFNIYV